MNRSRLIGLVLIALGVIIAVIAGLWLAVNAANGLNASDTIARAGLAFIPIGLLVGLGIYQYVRADQQEEAPSAMLIQREMLDLLKEGGYTEIGSLASVLGVDSDTIRTMIRELVWLQLFSGYVNWQTGAIRVVASDELSHLKTCVECGNPVRLEALGQATCRFCETEYFLT